jgi:hypothetical protein
MQNKISGKVRLSDCRLVISLVFRTSISGTTLEVAKAAVLQQHKACSNEWLWIICMSNKVELRKPYADAISFHMQAENRVQKRYTSTFDVFRQALKNKQLSSLYQASNLPFAKHAQIASKVSHIF